MKHSDSTKKKANVTSIESYDGSSTRELALAAPQWPIISFVALIVQIVVGIAAFAFVRPIPPLGIALFVVTLLLFLLTWQAWSWWTKYSASRIYTKKKLDSLAPGMWVVRPSGRFAVRVWEYSTGSNRNPSIADGLTREELAIIAPVYVFREPPKNSEDA